MANDGWITTSGSDFHPVLSKKLETLDCDNKHFPKCAHFSVQEITGFPHFWCMTWTEIINIDEILLFYPFINQIGHFSPKIFEFWGQNSVKIPNIIKDKDIFIHWSYFSYFVVSILFKNQDNNQYRYLQLLHFNFNAFATHIGGKEYNMYATLDSYCQKGEISGINLKIFKMAKIQWFSGVSGVSSASGN